LILACGALAIGLQSASAKPKRGGGGGGGGQAADGGGGNNVAPTSAPSNGQALAALQDMKDAEAAIDEMYETSPDWLNAQAAIKQAQSDYNDACGPVTEGLKTQPAYQAAVDAQSKAEADLVQQQNTGSATDISEAAQTAMQARSAVKAMESKALDTDPTTVAAKQKLTAAYAAMAALRQKEQDAVQTDPTWLAAKKRLDAARAK
jgi:hypothetical protein